MLLAIVCVLAVCEGARLPIEQAMKVPINSDKLSFETENPIQYKSISPRYFVYNIVQLDPDRPIPLIQFPYGQPGNSYVTSSFSYYGAPLYDYAIHYSPLFPSALPSIPTYNPSQESIPPSISTTQIPISIDDDNVEKLDEKVDPNLEMNSSNQDSMQDDDSVVIEAIDK